MKTKLILMGIIIAALSAYPVLAHEEGMDHDEAAEEHGMMAEDMDHHEMTEGMDHDEMAEKHEGMMDGMDQDSVTVVKEGEETGLPNAGNKICPVSGDKIGSDMGKGIHVAYKGKIYNLCCPMCIKDFKANPEKYIFKIQEELMNSGGTSSDE